jgi:hypothetical protein
MGIWLVVLITIAGMSFLPAQTGKRKKMDKETLAKRVETINPDVAAKVRAENSKIDQMETPFFAHGSIYRVTYFGPYRPITFVFGAGDDKSIVSLANNKKAFIEFAQNEGLRLDSDNLRLNYAETFLNSTRDFQSRFEIIRGFEDIKLINAPREDEKSRYAALRQEWEGKILPPKISGRSPSVVMFFALKRQDLVEIEVKVFDDGRLEDAEKILEKDIPIAYVK